MCDLIVSVPDHCLSFYFDKIQMQANQEKFLTFSVGPKTSTLLL